MSWWMWLLAGFSFVGVLLNIKRKRVCFVIWIFTNASWMVVDWQAGLIAQSVVFMAYTGLAVWGLWEWRGKVH